MADLVPVPVKVWSGARPVRDRQTVADALNTYFSMVARKQGENHIAVPSPDTRRATLGHVIQLARHQERADHLVRNQRIRCLYEIGIDAPSLAERFNLSADRIHRIVRVKPIERA